MELRNWRIRLGDWADFFRRCVIAKSEASDCRDAPMAIDVARLATLVGSSVGPIPLGAWRAHGYEPSRRTFGLAFASLVSEPCRYSLLWGSPLGALASPGASTVLACPCGVAFMLDSTRFHCGAKTVKNGLAIEPRSELSLLWKRSESAKAKKKRGEHRRGSSVPPRSRTSARANATAG